MGQKTRKISQGHTIDRSEELICDFVLKHPNTCLNNN